MKEGEVIEIGALKNGQEVNATWSTSSNTNVDVVDGGTIALSKSANNKIISSYNGESAETTVNVTENPISTRTGFKILDMNIGTVATYTVEFLVNGTKVNNTDIQFLNSNPEIAVIDNDGNVAGLTNGKTLITVLHGGKKYGHLIVVDDTILLKTVKKRTTKK